MIRRRLARRSGAACFAHRNDHFGNFSQFFSFVHGEPPHAPVGFGFVNLQVAHEDALGFFNLLALGEGILGVFEFFA